MAKQKLAQCELKIKISETLYDFSPKEKERERVK